MAAAIVVGFDGSDVSDRALERAIIDAKAASSRLVIVVVAPMPFDPLAPSTVGPWVLGPADPDEQALAHDVADNEPPPALQATVAEATKRARSAGVEPEIIWREILDAARDNNASKILLGVHHHRLLGALFGENVDAAVRREANCDVIAVA